MLCFIFLFYFYFLFPHLKFAIKNRNTFFNVKFKRFKSKNITKYAHTFINKCEQMRWLLSEWIEKMWAKQTVSGKSSSFLSTVQKILLKMSCRLVDKHEHVSHFNRLIRLRRWTIFSSFSRLKTRDFLFYDCIGRLTQQMTIDVAGRRQQRVARKRKKQIREKSNNRMICVFLLHIIQQMSFSFYFYKFSASSQFS